MKRKILRQVWFSLVLMSTIAMTSCRDGGPTGGGMDAATKCGDRHTLIGPLAPRCCDIFCPTYDCYPPPNLTSGELACSPVGLVCDWGEVQYTCQCDHRMWLTYSRCPPDICPQPDGGPHCVDGG